MADLEELKAKYQCLEASAIAASRENEVLRNELKQIKDENNWLKKEISKPAGVGPGVLMFYFRLYIL